MIVASFRITATLAVFAPRRVLIFLCHAFICGSLRMTWLTAKFKTCLAMELPALVTNVARWIADELPLVANNPLTMFADIFR